MRLQRRLYGICLVSFLEFGVPCRPKLCLIILYWMQKPKIKLQIVICFEFWVVFTVSSFVGNPVLSYYLRWLCCCCASCTLFQSFLAITNFKKILVKIFFNLYLYRQAENGMYVRMALLAMVLGKCWFLLHLLRWVYSIQCSVYSVHCAVYSVHRAPKIRWVYSIQWTVYSVHCKPKITQKILRITDIWIL